MSNKLMEIIAEILETEVEEISLATELNDFTWDSLAVVTFITEVHSEFEQLVEPTAVKNAQTVNDLVSLVG